MGNKEEIRLEQAKKIIQNELKKNVEINDDGTKPKMYDLRVGSSEKPEIAIEVTGAVNEEFTKTWNIGPAKGPLQFSSIQGDWVIEIAVETQIREFKQNIPQILKMLESQNRYLIRVDSSLQIH